MPSFISNINFWGSGRNWPFDPEKNRNTVFLSSLHQTSLLWGTQLELTIKHIIKVLIILHAKTSILGVYWWIQSNQQVHLELCHKNLTILKRASHVSKPDRIFNSTTGKGEVSTHASCETAHTWESFKQQGIKLLLFPDNVIRGTPKVLQARIACLQNLS